MKVIYPVTLTVAFCSIVYELLLAQSMAAVLGNTIVRYNVTIGIYLTSMGVGALLYQRFKPENYSFRFLQLELVLAWLGALAPTAVLIADGVLGGLPIPLHSLLVGGFAHALIILIGLLSGLELPMLMDYAPKVGRTANRVLVTDYLGTFVGALLFPLLLLPGIGLFGTAFLVALLNLLAAFLIYWETPDRPSLTWKVFGALTSVILLFALIYHAEFSDALIERYYLAGP